MLIVESFREIACKLCETLTKLKEVLIQLQMCVASQGAKGFNISAQPKVVQTWSLPILFGKDLMNLLFRDRVYKRGFKKSTDRIQFSHLSNPVAEPCGCPLQRVFDPVKFQRGCLASCIYILVYIFYFNIRVICKVQQSGGENGRFWHNRASNA